MKVLVLTDFSNNAKNASNFAINAINPNSEIILANTYKSDDAHEFSGNTNEYKAKEELAKEIERLSKLRNNLKIKPLASPGDPEDLAKRFEERGNADLIIMGTQGTSSVKRNLMGSNAIKVSKSTALPVLCIPENARFHRIKRIVLAVDYSNFEPEDKIFLPLINIAKEYDSEIMILSIVDKEEKIENARTINDLKRDVFTDVKTSWHFISSKKVVDSIEKFSFENDADILTVISQNTNFFLRLFKESVSEELLGRANLPILVLEED